MKKPVVVDFETEAIEARPKYPPKPVGVAILEPGKKPKYYAWGHPEKNNADKSTVKRILSDLWRSGDSLLFHNAKFDLDVAHAHFGLALPSWDKVHDTLFTLFLKDPHALSLSLKPAAEHWLGLPPEEQDAVKDWLVEHGVIGKKERPGPHISKVPGDVVGRYAIGDVVRTAKLHEMLYKDNLTNGMGEAYDRERRLLPILLKNEKEGIRVDLPRLEKDLTIYEDALASTDIWLRKKLKAPDLNFDSDAAVAAALRTSGVVTAFTKTKTGRDSVSKKNLTLDKFGDQRVAMALGYRNRLSTVLSMSMRPWFKQAADNKGYIFTEWNQVRQEHGNDGAKGTRSGRLSCSRFQNITKDFYDKGDGFIHPERLNVPDLPLVRRYLVADKDQTFGHVDYNQQEFRILAHFEDDVLQKSYRDNPRIDYHDNMRDLIHKMTGREVPRRLVKILNFGINYGMGVGKLAADMKVTVEEASQLRAAQKRAVPGVARLNSDLKERGRTGKLVRTWGGRVYYCEEPKEIKTGPRKGQMQTFEYKLLNYLIQGSAADCTKEAIIRYDDIKKSSRFLVTVHDEVNISSPKKAEVAEIKKLQKVMESIEFDVPMLTDAKLGKSWGELRKLEG